MRVGNAVERRSKDDAMEFRVEQQCWSGSGEWLGVDTLSNL
jgi:hypothetical protein